MDIDENIEFIKKLNDEDELNKATEEDIKKYVKLVKEYAEKDNEVGLDALGYASYGGNRAFPCDWKLAEKCFLKLTEITDESFYSNTLGYIYYYGRTGKPDYNKAWYYFSIGALGGVYESKYKISDMLIKGLPKQKNYSLACSILNEIYQENLELFILGNYDCKFADVALRMGGFVKRVILNDPNNFMGYNDEKALYFYLQAKFALDLRMKTINYYGDTSVRENIDDAINEVSSSIIFQNDLSHIIGYKIDDLVDGAIAKDTYIDATISKDMRKIHITCFKLDSNPGPFHLFVTIPDANFCNFVDGFDVVLDKDAKLSLIDTMNDKNPNKYIITGSKDHTYKYLDKPMFYIEGNYWIDIKDRICVPNLSKNED